MIREFDAEPQLASDCDAVKARGKVVTPTSPDPNRQKMMMLTPLIFTIMLINFPAGLSLYYFSRQ